MALVTGGSGGIGGAIVRRLAAAGAAVAVGYGQHGEAAEKVAAQIVSAGGRAVALGADLRDPAGPGQLAEGAEDALGPVDVLVSNAGLGGTKTLEEVTAADFDAMVAVNLRAPFLLAQRTLPGMAARGSADTVHVVGGRVHRRDRGRTTRRPRPGWAGSPTSWPAATPRPGSPSTPWLPR